MVGITSVGIGSGIDLESIITATIDAEDIPKQQLFAKKQTEVSLELSALSEVKSAAASLQDVIEKLADIDNFTKRTATISQPASGDVISVSASSEATAGNFDIEVIALAQGSRAVSNDGLFTDSGDTVTASGGNLTFTAGTKTFDVALSAGATLADLRNAINDHADNFGVSANIINTGTQAKLVYTSSITGVGNDLAVTNDIAELDNVSTVANAGGAGGVVIAAADQAKDAQLKIDNIDVYSDTNTFKDAIEDMTITALKESESGESATLTVATDKEGVTSLIDEFIAGYNNLIGMIKFKSRVDQPLNNEPIVRSFQRQLFNRLSSSISGAGSFTSIYSLGLSTDKDGYLEKSTIGISLQDNLTEQYDNVGEAFAGSDGFANKFDELLDSYLNSSGIFKQQENSLADEQARLDKDIAQHEYRMTVLEARLRDQYTGLDGLLGQLQATQSYISAQLASLPGLSINNKDK